MNYGELEQISINELGLSRRAYNVLYRNGLSTIGDVLSLWEEQFPFIIRGLGPKILEEITTALQAYLPNGVTKPVLENSSKKAEQSISRPAKSTMNELLENLALPIEVVNELRYQGILSVDTLGSLPLAVALSLTNLRMLNEEEWSRLIPKVKRLGLPNLINRLVEEKSDISEEADFTLLSLNLSNRVLHILRRCDIYDIQILLQVPIANLVTLPGFGPTALIEVLTKVELFLRNKSQSLGDNTDTPPLYRHQLSRHLETRLLGTKTTVGNVVDEWLSSLKERNKEIIMLRYGLADGRPRILEEVGEIYKISRERVRQIESGAIRQLRGHLRRPVMRQLFELIRHAIIEMGGFINERQLIETLNNRIEVENVSIPSLIQLLISSHGKFHWNKTLQAWCLSERLADLSIDIISQSIEILSKEKVPLLWEQFLHRLKSTEWFKRNDDQVSDDFIIASVSYDDRIVQYDNGYIGLEKWEKHYLDEIILALRHLGKPSHFREIAETVNASLRPDRRVTSRSIHAQLLHYSDIFVWIGRRGTYGLKEWGLERALTYEDALKQILEEAGSPLTFQEIMAKLPIIRPFYDESSIVLTLGTNHAFKGFLNNTYGLATWREDDLVTETYRVKRLLDTGDLVSERKTKRQIIEAIDDVADFIAQLRGSEL